MGERTSYLPGTPSWVDLGSPDPAAAAEFYGAVLGWTAEMDPRPEAGGYGMFSLRGKLVAGLGPQMNPDMPPYWTVYITVADVEAGAATVTAHGGQVVAGPMDVFDAGRMAVCQDPAGTFFSIWQPIEHIGSQLVNEVGTFCWTELATTDLASSSAFYRKVFGWTVAKGGQSEEDPEPPEPDEAPEPGAEAYLVDGKVTCGAHSAGPGEFPAWSVWFSVADCDASTAQVTALGGTVYSPPNDMDFGRGAVVADPQGAVFGIAALAQPDP